MNRIYASWVVAAVVSIGALFLWLAWRREAADLQDYLAVARGGNREVSIRIASRDSQRARLQGEVDSLAKLIETEREALKKAQESLRRLEEQMPENTGEITASYGRVENLGRELGDALCVWIGNIDMQKEGPDVTADSKVAATLSLISWVPRVHLFESRPDEIATFHSEALGTVFALEPAVVASVRTHIERHFSRMQAAELLAEHRPSSDEGEPGGLRTQWDQRRAEALTELMIDMRPLLPEDKSATLRFVMPGLLNLGIGMENGALETSDSTGQILRLPSWPPVPWE